MVDCMAKRSMVKRMALSAGILWGAGIFLLGVFSAAIGGILAFLDGAAAGAIFAYLYSRIR